MTSAKKSVSLDDLADMVQVGFNETYHRFDKVEGRLTGVEEKLSDVDDRLSVVEVKLDKALYLAWRTWKRGLRSWKRKLASSNYLIVVRKNGSIEPFYFGLNKRRLISFWLILAKNKRLSMHKFTNILTKA